MFFAVDVIASDAAVAFVLLPTALLVCTCLSAYVHECVRAWGRANTC